MYEKFGQFIDGKWQKSSDKSTYEVINPANEEIIGCASKATSKDVDAALKSAAKGLQIWKKCQKQFEQIFSNANHSINLDIQHQALLNFLISRSVGMHDGAMFNQDQYPQTTQQLYQHIQQHLDTVDSRFD